ARPGRAEAPAAPEVRPDGQGHGPGARGTHPRRAGSADEPLPRNQPHEPAANPRIPPKRSGRVSRTRPWPRPGALLIQRRGWYIKTFEPLAGPRCRLSVPPEGFVASVNYSDVRKGQVIVGDDGQLYLVVDRDLHTPGSWRANVNLKLKNLKTGAVTPRRFKPEDKVEVAYLETREFQYLYQDGDDYVFMDKETYDQITLSKDWVGDAILYLKENDTAKV